MVFGCLNGRGVPTGFVGEQEMRDCTADPRRYEQLSEETRTLAHDMKDPDARWFMRMFARGYQVLAEQA